MAALGEIVAAEGRAVAAFVRLLKAEQEALQRGEADALPELVDKKAAAVRALAPLSAARNAALADAGLPGERAGIDAWLRQNPNDEAVRNGWRTLQALAAEAKELNRVNGELIRLRLQHNTQALEALLAATHRLDLYGADGQAAPAGGGRIIDSA